THVARLPPRIVGVQHIQAKAPETEGARVPATQLELELLPERDFFASTAACDRDATRRCEAIVALRVDAVVSIADPHLRRLARLQRSPKAILPVPLEGVAAVGLGCVRRRLSLAGDL